MKGPVGMGAWQWTGEVGWGQDPGHGLRPCCNRCRLDSCCPPVLPHCPSGLGNSTTQPLPPPPSPLPPSPPPPTPYLPSSPSHRPPPPPTPLLKRALSPIPGYNTLQCTFLDPHGQIHLAEAEIYPLTPPPHPATTTTTTSLFPPLPPPPPAPPGSIPQPGYNTLQCNVIDPHVQIHLAGYRERGNLPSPQPPQPHLPTPQSGNHYHRLLFPRPPQGALLALSSDVKPGTGQT